METVVRVEGNNEGKFEETGVEKSSSPLSSPKLGGDQVVYKLVRIEGDGRLVPATDDEIMEVGNLLSDDKIEMHLVGDTGQTGGCICSERTSSGMPQLENSEGLSQSENTEVDAGKSNVHLEENDPSSAPSMNESHINQSGSVGECSNPPNELVEGQSSASADCTSLKPDFSKLKGEICLDNLSIKELHETFKATFGRETTVKDKQWLKRRIAMGLTNSCDVSTSSFVIKDNKLVNKDKEENHNNLGSDLAKAPAVRTANDSYKDSPINCSGQMENLQIVSDERLRNSSIDDDFGTEDLNTEQRAAKRVRKPTRRYIEELSEVESKEHSGKSIASTKNPGLRQISIKSNVRPFKMARMESFGGSGVQVPYVFRVRRSRPRKNIMALMFQSKLFAMVSLSKPFCMLSVLMLYGSEIEAVIRLKELPSFLQWAGFHPSSMSVAATLVKKALVVHNTQPNNESRNEVLKARSAPEQIQQPFTVEPEMNKQFLAVGPIEQGQNMEPKHIDPSGDASDDNVVSVPTGKGGMRRKHHRAWTLSEVMKLVEGVSRYGAGRWSEIKRLAFASYSYRTSVDLKDKWRNLLKASLAQTPPDKRMNSRKHASAMPIPAPILLRVRELAEMQQQVSPNLSSGKLAGSTGRNVHETRSSGYL
ncbi:hypothetical protein JRO89_XS09G0226300 [Xanthoceras sorbifolium]|uniref:Uncharacterized protein n=1 Tax=Xanthoceras sorbifolium TaxID=99658 RepID=A0ABQ8HMH2_9ROSI|nr:hypothetical protein JRO89_XS09G0226300 [Xanthoceras sorbifolium]